MLNRLGRNAVLQNPLRISAPFILPFLRPIKPHLFRCHSTSSESQSSSSPASHSPKYRTLVPIPDTPLVKRISPRKLKIAILSNRPLPKNWFESGLPVWTFSESAILEANMPKAAFYGVQKGRTPGVYSTWSECEEQIKGFKGAIYKKFGTASDAEAFVSSNTDPTKPYATSKASPNTSKPPSPKDSPPKMKKGQMPMHSKAQSQGYTISDEGNLVVYCDGSSRGNGKAGAKAGLGVYWGSRGLANDRNIAEPLPGLLQTNNRGELLAIVRAIESNPFPELTLEIRTDSQYSIQCLTQWLPSWLRRGFKTASGEPVKNYDIIVHLWVLLQRAGMRKIRFTYVKGHAGHYGNEEADRLANLGAAQPYPGEKTDWLTLADLEKPPPSSNGKLNGHQKTNGHGKINGNGMNGTETPSDAGAEDGDPLKELGVEIDLDPNLQLFATEEEYDF